MTWNRQFHRDTMQISSFQKIEEEEIGNDDLMSSG